MAISTQSGRRISICKFTPSLPIPLPGHSWLCQAVLPLAMSLGGGGSQLGLILPPLRVEGVLGALGVLFCAMGV